jgi:hypothetical protein
MNLEQLAANFKQLNEEIEKAMAQMKSDSQALVEQAAQELFQAAPEIDCIFWRQYTPYFNDGEPCSFSRHDIYYNLAGDDPDDCEGSYLYTQDDYERALKNLQTVTEYVKDPLAWFNKIKIERNLPHTDRPEWHLPWPRTVEAAQAEVANIELQRTAYSVEDADRINNAFEQLCAHIQLIPDEIMLAVYGDHAKITISREGTVVDHYDHD